MNILLESRVFHPSVGGMETVARQLAEAWVRRGHDVQIATQTPIGSAEEVRACEVYRLPSLSTRLRLLSNADVYVQSGISLKTLPLGWITQTPMVVIHHNMLPLKGSTIGVRNGMKRVASRFSENIAVSEAVANDLPRDQTSVIHNPFEPSFSDSGQDVESHRLLFVGRLVSVKGADIALRAIAELDERYILDICGEGPERDALEELAHRLKIADRVTFHGWVDHQDLAPLAQAAAIQLIPSRYEPFGIVALEGIAAGCAIVAADTGGLPEAVGPCGVLVSPNDSGTFAEAIHHAAANRSQLLSHRQEHLRHFHIDTIADQYLDVFSQAVCG
ncbi:hypothetical protein CRI94_13960 [Longibacter salinarum]|uniref:Glycosyl transferase family 1 n=1 Tax=Longibacter salinarum TaxID=1850348 RepID=A0A2A8CVE1_9BACT|nr:glycosyltransferase family 4 protein [Longibacter salinarum]PEN12616.1 hypothetical protein CRI94_13960 [Longibacter salinarum]